MAPSEYSLRLQKGITGGFAPPTPTAVHTVTRPKDHPELIISSAERSIGTPSLQDFAPKNIPHSGTTEALIDELHSLLKKLPMESPPGSEDIYGLDTSIFWGSEDLEWYNGGPAGCNGTGSQVQATEEQKKQFKRAVEIVEQLVKG